MLTRRPPRRRARRGYNPPEYLFTVEMNDQKFGEKQESEILEFKDFV